MRRVRLLGVLACLLVVGCASETGGVLPSIKKSRPAVVVPVALDGWTRVGPDLWRTSPTAAEAGPVDDKAFLVSLRERGDFRLTIEYRVDAETNSGVFIRCENPLRITPSTCYEINIWDQHPKQDWRTGSIVTYQKAQTHVDGLGRWVKLEIEARGSTIKAWFDGVQTVHFDAAKRARGRVALQYGGSGVVAFRNPRIEALR